MKVDSIFKFPNFSKRNRFKSIYWSLSWFYYSILDEQDKIKYFIGSKKKWLSFVCFGFEHICVPTTKFLLVFVQTSNQTGLEILDAHSLSISRYKWLIIFVLTKKWFINNHHELHETKLTTVEIQEACHGI